MAERTESGQRGRRRRLGRGLDSLLKAPVKVDLPAEPASAGRPDPDPEPQSRTATASPAEDSPPAGATSSGPALQMIPLDAVQPNPHQPRRSFDEEALGELAASIQAAGLMQPVVVRPARDGGGYELIAGERRWRAAGMIGLKEIPAVVHTVDDQTAAEWALIENIQRKDLSPIERAEAYQTLSEQFGLSHQRIAERVGLQRTSITNHLRLLELDEHCLAALQQGDLDMGHARALLAVADTGQRVRLAELAAREGWSVRRLESAIRTATHGATAVASREADATSARKGSPSIADLESRLQTHLGTKVRIRPGRKKGSGSLTVDFYSFDEFEGLLRRLGFDPDRDS